MDTGRQKMWFEDAKRHYAHRRQTPKKILDGRWTPKKIPPRTPDAKPIPPLGVGAFVPPSDQDIFMCCGHMLGRILLGWGAYLS